MPPRTQSSKDGPPLRAATRDTVVKNSALHLCPFLQENATVAADDWIEKI